MYFAFTRLFSKHDWISLKFGSLSPLVVIFTILHNIRSKTFRLPLLNFSFLAVKKKT